VPLGTSDGGASADDGPTRVAFAPSLPPPSAPRAPAPDLDREIAAARADPSRRFGHFLLLSQLGQGAMGVVHRAWDEKLHRIVALKTLLATGDPTAIKRFRREAEAVARLKHPHIVSIHEVGETAGKHWLAMDLVTGKTLKRRLQPVGEEKRIPLATAVRALRDVARAVQHAHDQGVLHRDLKPENLILDESDHARVLDFGLALVRGTKSTLTKTGASVGTPSYMPPEQAFGEGVPDERSDVYSLGATLYHVLTGNPPFEGPSEVSILAAVVTKDPVRPRRIDPTIPADLETICLECLEKSPAKRYASAGALADDLERYLAGEPIAARPVGRLERLLRRARRNKLALALGAVVLVVVPVTVAVFLHRSRAGPASHVETVAEALVALARDDGDPARHRETLAGAIHGPAWRKEALVRELDAAIGHAPRSLELRRGRALLDRTRSVPVLAADLAAVGSMTGVAEDLESVLEQAASAGLEGEDAAAVARSVWRAHPELPAAALVFALTAAGAGDASRRGEIVEALRAAHSDLVRAQNLKAALDEVDRAAALLADPDQAVREGAATGTLLVRLRGRLPALGLLPGLARAPAVALASLGAGVRGLIQHASPFEGFTSERLPEIVALVDQRELADAIDPQLFVLGEMLRNDAGREAPQPAPVISSRRFEEAGKALAATDPLVAAYAFERAAWAVFRDGTPGPGARAIELAERSEASIADFGRTGAPTSAELNWEVLVLHASAGVAEAGHLRLAGELAARGDEPSRRSECERALADARRAANLSSHQQNLSNRRDPDSLQVVGLLLDLGRLEATEPALADLPIPRRDALLAEAIRRQGKPALALERARAIAPACPESEAVWALAATDLGRDAEARDHLLALEALVAKGEPPLDRLASGIVRAYVESQGRR
jgi:hypothetical protein